MGYYRFPRYVSVAEKRAKAEKKIKQLRKKNADIQPVCVDGRSMAKTWWGKAWNENLERYADFENRIGRGRSYLRNRAVLDLRIEAGKVHALVQGSTSKPYEVTVRIRPLGKKNWAAIKGACAGRIDSMHHLLEGRFPESLSALFTAQGEGLFPSPEEIEFDCSCPDWAYMCKHVAATLYGIGARLDVEPALFFRLRKVKIEDLVSQAMAETTERLLERAKKGSDRVIDDADLGDVFGIVMEDRLDFGQAKPPVPRKKRAPKGRLSPKKMAGNASGKKKRTPASNKEWVLELVENTSGGIDVPTLAEKTGLSPVRVRSIVYGACKKRLIERAGRGIFRGRARKEIAGNEAEKVLGMIQAAAKGHRIADIQAETKLPAARVRNILARALAKGDIARLSRGVYGRKRKAEGSATASDTVFRIIQSAKKGVAFSQLRESTGMEEKKLRNIVFRLSRQGKIRSVIRGVYATVE
ncbi:MAG: hypothetical protein JEZ11_19255 [Desulfobacterales bacterium]|nr:hypothetical protein [Desulfobacterales bacterium]